MNPQQPEQQYLLMYGAGISRAFREEIGIARLDSPIPVRLSGVKRYFGLRKNEDTVLCISGSALYRPNFLNGVLVEVSRDSLDGLIKKESSRGNTLVKLDEINHLSNGILQRKLVGWGDYANPQVQNVYAFFAEGDYSQKNDSLGRKPDDKKPVMLSYIDMIVEGCLSLVGEQPQSKSGEIRTFTEEEAIQFITEFFRTTDNLGPINNDRLKPHYGFKTNYDRRKVQQIVNSHIKLKKQGKLR